MALTPAEKYQRRKERLAAQGLTPWQYNLQQQDKADQRAREKPMPEAKTSAPRGPAAPKAAPRKRKTYPDMSAALDEVEEWMTEGVGLVSVVLAWVMSRKVQPANVRRAVRDELAMTNEEAQAIAEPAAKIFVRSQLNKRYGKHLVASNDYVKLGMALYDYVDRITDILKNGVVVHVVQHSEPVQQAQQAAASNGNGGSNGFYPGVVVPAANAA